MIGSIVILYILGVVFAWFKEYNGYMDMCQNVHNRLKVKYLGREVIEDHEYAVKVAENMCLFSWLVLILRDY